jgi:hypothetical protein
MKSYVLQAESVNLPLVANDWLQHDFYRESVVLGIDIGLQGIGIYLRKGRRELYAKTLLFEVPETGRLESRRQKRAWRHARKNRATRRSRLKTIMHRHGLPWVEDEVLSKTDPFLLRARAIQGKLASPEALSICIRHLVDHRGFDYSAFAQEGEYPWGATDSSKKVIEWIGSNFVNETIARDLLSQVAPFDWNEAEVEKFRATLEERRKWSAAHGIEQVLEEYQREKKPNLRTAARRHNFPRTMVEHHLRTIISRHAELISDVDTFTEALFLKPRTKAEKARAIFHYNRKVRAEAELLWKRRIKKCPFSVHLGLGVAPVATNSSPEVGAWKALEFLCTRRFEVGSKLGRPWLEKTSPQAIQRLIEFARRNRILFNEKNPLVSWREIKSVLTSDVTERFGKGVKPTADSASEWNKGYFAQLKDILRPTVANLRGNASLSEGAAARLFEIGTASGANFDPESVLERLNELEFYEKRRSAFSSHVALYPQVEFLLGRRVERNGQLQRVATGRLQRVFANLSEVLGAADSPDYCVVEVIRDAPRNQSQKVEYLKLQQARRTARDARFAELGITDSGNSSLRRRVLLHHQQGGLSPFTGNLLPDPSDPALEIEHLFPESRGGLSCDENLVLTFRTENNDKGNRTPKEAAEAGLPGWLPWSEMLRRSEQMRWSRAKREIFAFEPTETALVPEFGNTTRTSQLARQLVREVQAWMGIEHDAEAQRRRVGTPSGWLTAQARKSWLERDGYLKVRSQLVHHLIDAAILAHIPPAAGLNHVRYGGIFHLTPDRKTRALSELAPDLSPWLVETPAICPVEKTRSNSRTRPLGDETFWAVLPPDESNVISTRQRTKLDHNKFSDGVALHAALCRMRIPSEKIPNHRSLQSWLDRAKTGDAEPLQLLDGTPVRNVHKFNGKGGFTVPLGWSAKPTPNGTFREARSLDGKFDRMEIWVGWNARRKAWAYYARLIPTRVALRHLQQTRPGWWNEHRFEVCGKLPRFAHKIGQLRRGDQILMPLDREGEIVSTHPYTSWWFEVTAIQTNGQLEMKCITHRSTEGTLLSHLPDNILSRAPKNAEVIATLLGKKAPEVEAGLLGLHPPRD